MEVRSARLVTAYPERLRIFDEYIEVTPTRELSGKNYQRARYEQTVQVKLRRGFLFSNLVIETKGSGILSVFGLSHRAAKEAKELIERIKAGRLSV
jgi:hypothetical protein